MAALRSWFGTKKVMQTVKTTPVISLTNLGELEGLSLNRWSVYTNMEALLGGLAASYQPHPLVVDRGTTARYGGQLRYI